MDFKEEIIKVLKKHVRLKEIPLETPPDSYLGDYAFPCFVLAKKANKNPKDIARELSKKIKPDKLIREIKATGPYLNFFINKETLAEKTFSKILKEKKDYGKGNKKREKTMVEYCQVNTHKTFHVGHLRGTLLGDSVIRILRFNGYDVISSNYQGDTGTHVAKVLWYLTKHFKGPKPKNKRGEWLGEIYQKANKKIGDKKELKKQVSETQQLLEKGDKKLTKLWKETRQWSLDDFNMFYDDVGVSFDKLFFESQFEKPGKKIVQEMLKNKKAEMSEGAAVINLEKYNLGVFLLLKTDGTALYSTKDLALAEEKFKRYRIKRSVYVVGSEQTLHLRQTFKTLELLGFEDAKQCVHVPYDLVTLKGGKISSREGELIFAEELVRRLIKAAEQGIKERHKLNKKEIEKRARQIGLAALRFGFLSQDNNKEIVFDMDRSLEFEGETGPYIQYAHARICSILKRYDKKLDKKVKFDYLVENVETEIIKLLRDFPEIAEKAARQYKPALISNYSLLLAQRFNEFYHSCQILKENKDLKKARLLLIDCIRQVLEINLNLLGIEAPEAM